MSEESYRFAKATLNPTLHAFPSFSPPACTYLVQGLIVENYDLALGM